MKICDFGFATHCGATKLQAGAIGSPLYMAPELVRNVPYLGAPVDLWALGCVCYELLHGRFAFKAESIDQLHTRIRKAAHEPISKSLSVPARQLISSLIVVPPGSRMSAADVALLCAKAL